MSELKAYNCNEWHNEYTEFYLKSEADNVIAEKDKTIALLKERICNGDVSRLTWIDDCIAKDKEITELKQKLENVQASIYCDVVDANIENRRLKRALWIARAERAASWQIHFSLCHNHSIEREFSINGASMPCEGMATMRTAKDWAMIWEKVERLCLKKAEEYK